MWCHTIILWVPLIKSRGYLFDDDADGGNGDDDDDDLHTFFVCNLVH